MTKLEKEVRGIIFDLLDDEELKVNENYEIEYTQEWLDNWLKGMAGGWIYKRGSGRDSKIFWKLWIWRTGWKKLSSWSNNIR